MGNERQDMLRSSKLCMRQFVRLAVTLVSFGLLAACGSVSSVGTVSAEVDGSAEGNVVPEPAQVATEEEQLIPFTVLVEGAAVGDPDSVEIIRSATELQNTGIDASVDFGSQVVFVFTLTESGSPQCALQPMTALIYETPYQRMYPKLATVDLGDVSCTADANPHQIVVAVNRADLPVGAFSLWISSANVPGCCDDGSVSVAHGELTTNAEFPAVGADGTVAVGETRIMYGLTTHCGLATIFRPIDGSQWTAIDSSSMTGIDPMPAGWSMLGPGGEQSINLVIERTGENTLTATAVGTDVSVDYRRAVDASICQ